MDESDTFLIALVGPRDGQRDLYEVVINDGVVSYRVNEITVTQDVYRLCLETSRLNDGYEEDEDSHVS